MTIVRLASLAVCLLVARFVSAAETSAVDSAAPAVGPSKPVPQKTAPQNDGAQASTLAWHDAQDLTIEGQGWADTRSPFDRLPARAESKVRAAVWNLSRHSAGIAARFVTDATTLHVRWSLTSDQLAMPHMAATGVSGLDLYVRDADAAWRWLACAQPTQQTNELRLVSGMPAGRRTYLLYLPLYNGVKTLEIGVPNGTSVSAAPRRPVELRKPIVFYGTSITQGACASRPGMCHAAQLGRRFDRPVINLGFSGNGELEIEVAELLAELDAAVFVIDCLPNLAAHEVLARTEPCLQIIRRAHSQTPILLVEDRTYSNAFLISAQREKNLSNRRALRKVYQQLLAAGDENLYYLAGDRLLGDDSEGTVDSSHPNDLGFWRQADAMAGVLQSALAQPAQ